MFTQGVELLNSEAESPSEWAQHFPPYVKVMKSGFLHSVSDMVHYTDSFSEHIKEISLLSGILLCVSEHRLCISASCLTEAAQQHSKAVEEERVPQICRGFDSINPSSLRKKILFLFLLFLVEFIKRWKGKDSYSNQDNFFVHIHF